METSFPEPPEFVAHGDRVLMIGFAAGKIQATTKTFEDDFVFAITVRGGKVPKIGSVSTRKPWYVPPSDIEIRPARLSVSNVGWRFLARADALATEGLEMVENGNFAIAKRIAA